MQVSSMPRSVEVRAFNPELDGSWLNQLWAETMHARWALAPEAMLALLADLPLALVAEREGVRLGFCAADVDRFDTAGLVAMLVEFSVQKQGIGTELLLHMEAELRARGIRTLTLGAVSGGTYFWPGLPAEQDAAWSFFQQRGWVEQEGCADLVHSLRGYRTPEWVSARLEKAGVGLRSGTPELRDRIEAFEAAHFPVWAPFVAHELQRDGGHDLLVAETSGGEVAGTVLLKAHAPMLWTSDHAANVGSINLLGGAPDRQRQGIGLALTARAMEVLEQRGCSRCLIQWTGLTEWYGRLGAEVWAGYRMAAKAL